MAITIRQRSTGITGSSGKKTDNEKKKIVIRQRSTGQAGSSAGESTGRLIDVSQPWLDTITPVTPSSRSASRWSGTTPSSRGGGFGETESQGEGYFTQSRQSPLERANNYAQGTAKGIAGAFGSGIGGLLDAADYAVREFVRTTFTLPDGVLEEKGLDTPEMREDIQRFNETMNRENPVVQGILDLSDQALNESAEQYARSKVGVGPLGSLAMDLGRVGVEMLTDAGIAAATGGSGLIPMAVRSFGAGSSQAQREGASSQEAFLSGAAQGTIDAATERLFGIALPFARLYGGGSLDDVVQRGIQSAVSRFASTEAGQRALGGGLTVAASALTEGAEEFIADWASWQLPNIIYGGDVASVEETLSNSLYDFMLGSVMGGLGGVVSPSTYNSRMDRLRNGAMVFASLADSRTWGRLWNACELEILDTRPSLQEGSEEFYSAVAQRFTDVVDQTQVVDNVLGRSQFMRSGDNLAKMAASYMGEPTQTYNMLYRAYRDMAQEQDPKKRSQAIKRLGRTAAAVTFSAFMTAVAAALWDGVRDDEDRDEKYWERVLKHIGPNFAQNVNPAGMLPYARDILSIVQGYDVSRMDLEAVTSLFSALQNMQKAVNGEGRYTVRGAALNLAAELARITGLPLATVKRDAQALARFVGVETEDWYFQYQVERALNSVFYSGNRGEFYDIAFGALADGDLDVYEQITQDLMLNSLYKNGFTAKAAVQYTGDLNSEAEQNFLRGLEAYATGKMDATKTFIPVPLGSKIEPLNIKLTDSQFIELRKHSALQIAAAFGVKPNQVNDYEKSSFANSESQQLAFLTDTLLWILKGYEEELSWKLLEPEQINRGEAAQFNTAVMLRADTKTQIESMVQAVANSVYMPNEARAYLGMASAPGGDRLIANGNIIPLEDVGKQYGSGEE